MKRKDDYSKKKKNMSVFIWASDNCFRTYLKNCDQNL